MIGQEELPMVATYFPVVVCLWFMLRMEKILRTNTETMDKINLSLISVYKNLKRMND